VTDLWTRYRKTGDVRLRNEIAERYVGTVFYWAKRMKARVPHNVSEEELASAGFGGLLEAVERFDPSRGFAFTTYCPGRIRGAMLDYLRSQDYVPRLTRTRANRLAHAIEALERRNLRPPTDAELASELGLSAGRLERLRRQVARVAAAEAAPAGEALLPLELVENRGAVGPAAADGALDMAALVCRRLRPRERYVVVMHYAENLTLAEIGAVLGLSESRVCQLHEKALARLRRRAS
jgi:RNA polymerase sigma factor for flagellar operon FliA